MKHRIGRALIILVLLGCVSTAHAVNFQVPQQQTITQIRNYGTYAVLRYTPGITNTLDCGGASGTTSKHAAITFGSDANFKVMYAAALAAMVNGNVVGMGINNAPCNKLFGGGIPNIYRIDLGNN